MIELISNFAINLSTVSGTVLLAIVSYPQLLDLILWLKEKRGRNPSHRDLNCENDSLDRFIMLLPWFEDEQFLKKKLQNLQHYLELGDVDFQVWILCVEEERQTYQDLVDAFELKNEVKFPIRVMAHSEHQKVHLLNHAISKINSETVVIVSDVDAMFDSQLSLQKLKNQFAADHNLSLVGAICRPSIDAYHLEQFHWKRENQLRLREEHAFGAFFPVAPFYAFRRTMMEAFPDDCVSDDIYVALKCLSKGDRIALHKCLNLTEQRVPQSWQEYRLHKFRKLRTLYREVFRREFIGNILKSVFLVFRYTQLVLGPIAFFVLCISLMLENPIFSLSLLIGGIVLFSLVGKFTSRLKMLFLYYSMMPLWMLRALWQTFFDRGNRLSFRISKPI